MRQGCTSAASGRHVNVQFQDTKQRRLKRLLSASSTAVAMAVAASTAHGVTYSWTNTGTDWNTAANWTGTVVSSPGALGAAANDLANFPNPATVQPNLSASVAIARISFQSAATGYNITATNGSTITLNATGTGASSAINSATNVSEEIAVPLIFNAGSLQTINAGGTMKLSGPITATANPMQVTSTGTLQLTNSGNNFSGGVTLAGTSTSKVNFVNGGLGSSGNVTFTGTTWLQYATGNTQDMSARIVNSTSAMSIDANGNAVTFSTPIASTNVGGLTLVGPAVTGGSLTLATANNYIGNTTIAVTGGLSSTLNIQNAGALGPASNNLVVSGNSGIFDNTAPSGALTIPNGLQMGGNMVYVGTHDLTVNGAVNFTGTATRTFTVNGSNLTLNGNITSSTGRLGKSGTGTLTLTGNNTGLAGVGLNNGRLNIGSATALGSGANSLFTTAGGTTFDNVSGGPLTMANNFSGVDFIFAGSNDMTFAGTADITVGFDALTTVTHALTLGGTNRTLTLAGALANNVTDASVPTVAANNGLGGSGNTLVVGGAKLTSPQATSTSLGMSFGGNANVIVNGPVVDGTKPGGHLTVTGGVWTFNAANTYTGTTTVTGGRMQTTSAASLPSYNSPGVVTVNTGGTLGVNAGAPSGQWTDAQINDLYANATLNAGSNLAIDTTGGNFSYGFAMNKANGLVKLGANTLTLPNANTYSGGTTVAAGTLLIANADATGGGSLDVKDGALARVQAALPKAVSVTTLNTNTSGKFDLTNNSMVVKGMADPAVRTQLQAGYNGGAWSGATGIVTTSVTSETSVGYATNAQLGNLTEFKGVTGLTGTDVLVKYTYAGDANLDGKVDIGDLGLLAGAWQQLTGKVWFDGDFTYDGAVDIGDLGLLAGNWQKGTAGNPNPPLMSFNEAMAQFSAFDGVAVPEPATLGLLAAAAMAGFSRRRRH